MQLRRTGSGRAWECVINDCYAISPIPPDTNIPSSVISEDMARGALTRSTELKALKTRYRRVAGGLRNAAENRYLSEAEQETMSKAAKVLDRLAGAADHANKQKLRLEREEQQRMADRKAEATRGAHALFDAENVRHKACTALALADVNGVSPPLSSGWIKALQRRNPTSLREAIAHQVESAYREMVRELADNLAWRYAPVPELLAKAEQATLEAFRRHSECPAMTELEDALLIESAANIERLPTHRKP